MKDKNTATSERRGHCLCGDVTVVATNPGNRVAACHCKMCRRWGGSAFMEIECGSEVSFGGRGSVSVFDSSEWAERGFCGNCGTHLFYRLKETQQHMIPVGLFDDDSGLAFERQVFIDEKPAYYGYANKTEEVTGAELFAQYAPPE